MPLYEYTCSRCESDFELLVRGDEPARCPACESEKLKRNLSVVSAHSTSTQPGACEAPSPQGCGLPQCGGGQCGLG